MLCSEGKISGVTREGHSWMIPADAKKPEDGRFMAMVSLLPVINKKKMELESGHPLTEGELKWRMVGQNSSVIAVNGENP